MAKFSETKTYEIHCPICASDHVVKVGIRNGQQRYLCRNCKKKFRANGKATGQKMEAELVGSAIQDHYDGKSYKKIAEALEKEYDIPEPSKATVYEWVRDFTAEAVDEMKEHKATTGGDWVADELVVDVGGKKAYLWNVMDSQTRYILATHLSPRRDSVAARALFRKAMKAADKPPRTVTTDKWRPYIKPIKEILPDAKHMQSEGLRADINNNLSERLQGTIRDRLKTMRGLDRINSGQRYLDGWVIHYNLFRKHHSLRNQTPGSRAKLEVPFKEWTDVVKADAVEPQLVTATPRRNEKADAPAVELTGTPTPSKPKKSSQASGSGAATPRIVRPTKPKPAKRETAPSKGRSVKKHPMYKLRQKIRRAQGGRR